MTSLRGARAGSLLVMVLCAPVAAAQDEAPPHSSDHAADSPDAPPDDSALAEARERLLQIVVNVQRDDSRVVLEPTADPVLRFADPDRMVPHGFLWVWGKTSRPAAVLELFEMRPGRWWYVANNLSDGISADRKGGSWWTPANGAIQFVELDGPPSGTADAAERVLQLQAISRRFAAHEFWDPNNLRYELRLLPRPVHSYDDAARGILAGAMFVFAFGENPEALLFIEAFDDNGRSAWRYGMCRMGHAEMHVELDGEDVWTVPRMGATKPTDAYWLFVD